MSRQCRLRAGWLSSILEPRFRPRHPTTADRHHHVIMPRTTVDIAAPIPKEIKALQREHGRLLGQIVSQLLARRPRAALLGAQLAARVSLGPANRCGRSWTSADKEALARGARLSWWPSYSVDVDVRRDLGSGSARVIRSALSFGDRASDPTPAVRRAAPNPSWPTCGSRNSSRERFFAGFSARPPRRSTSRRGPCLLVRAGFPSQWWPELEDTRILRLMESGLATYDAGHEPRCSGACTSMADHATKGSPLPGGGPLP